MPDEIIARDEQLRVLRGDLTACEVDAIVNAANPQLAHGGGVAAAIAEAAGPQLQADSDAWVAANGQLEPGTAAVTPGHRLPAEHVIHVVGPVHADGQDNAGLLRQTVEAALAAAEEIGASSVALPAISAGVYGYPPQEAASVITAAARDWIAARPDTFDEVLLVAFDQKMSDRFAAALSPG